MIFFSGWGLLFVPAMGAISFGVAVALAFLAGITGLDKNVGLGGSFIIGGAVGALLCWYWGKKLNDRSTGRVLVDPKTGKEVTLHSRNSLMFVPVQYWAFVIFGLFALVAFNPPTGA